MVPKKITLEGAIAKYSFLSLPQQVKRTNELPNWTITLVDPKNHSTEKVYLQIEAVDAAGYQEPIEYFQRNFCDYLVGMLDDTNFVEMFGQLVLNTRTSVPPTEDKDYRVAKEMHNFFRRRGRNVETKIDAVKGKCSPITMAMDSDVTFITTCFNDTPPRHRGITGSVTILGQHHNFSMQHPLFDLSRMMTGTDARKNIVTDLRKAFPFIQASDIKGWTFATHVQGK